MKKEKFISRLFEKKNWRKVIQVLSCLVVFCTTYALILPAITQEANAYCGTEQHEHGPDCYKKILSCSREEHQHDDLCRDEEGNLICSKEEHSHGNDCYREVMNCQKAVHQHSLICFSNPNADLETADNWNRSLPQTKDRKPTTRENVIAAAYSQENVKESDRNYEVDYETEIRGITRYGQWDGHPYEDNWSGAFVRFVMHYGGVSSDKIHAKTDLNEWMKELSRLDLLRHISEGKEGDVIFVLNSEGEIRAGLILSLEDKENTLTAMMGDWGGKVVKQKYSQDSDKIHSVFRLPVTDDPIEDDQVNEDDTEAEVKSEALTNSNTGTDNNKQQEDSEKKDDYNSSKTDKNEEEVNSDDQNPAKESDETSDNDKENDKESEITQTADLENVSVTASWNKDNFKEQTDLNFKPEEKQLSEEEQQLMKEQLQLGPHDRVISIDLEYMGEKTKESSKLTVPEKMIGYRIGIKDSDGEDLVIRNIFAAEDQKFLTVENQTNPSGKETEFEFSGSSILLVCEDLNEFDYEQTYTAEDGTEVTAKWNEGTFSSSDISMQVRKKDVDEEVRKKIIDLDKSKITEEKVTDSEAMEDGPESSLVTYDISFYERTQNGELAEVEPNGPVRMSVEFKNKPGAVVNSVWHQKNSGELENLTESKETIFDKSKVDFVSASFSDYTFDVSGDSGIMTLAASDQNFDSTWNFNKYYWAGTRSFKLTQNVNEDNDNADQNKNVNLNTGDTVEIDLNGHYWKIKGTITVSNGTRLVIKNSNSRFKTAAGDIGQAWDASGNYSTTRVKYHDKEGKNCYAEAGGLITSPNTVIKVLGKNDGDKKYESKLTVSGGAAVQSVNSTAIVSEARGQVELNSSYVVSSKGGIGLYFGADLVLNSGSVISLNNNPDRGGGIFAIDTRNNGGDGNRWFGPTITMNAGSLISSNTAISGGGISIGRVDSDIPAEQEDQNFARSCIFAMNGGVIAGNKSTKYEGGGLALQNNSRSRATLYAGEFYRNEVTTTDWGGGGIFAALGNYLWMPNGASIYENTADGLGGGLTGCATGKMIIDPSLLVFQNTANATNFGSESDKPKVYNYKNQVPGYYDASKVNYGYKGDDIFGAEKTQVSGVFSYNGETFNANWQGNVDKYPTTDFDGTTLNAYDWLTLKCMLPNSQTDNYKSNQLIIHGNKSNTNAGGVLINGWLVTGSIETQYLGKSVELQSYKSLVDENGQKITQTDRQFRFKVTEINDPDAPAVATGYNNGEGLITFDSKLPVGDQSQTTYTFYLMEDTAKMPAGYVAGGEIYQINISVSDETTTTFYMPVWNASKQAYEARQVRVIQRKISSVSYKKLPDGSTQNLGAVEKFNVGSVSSAAFTNLKKDKTSITVRKEWSDKETDHSGHQVVVALLIKETGVEKERITLNQGNNWEYTWNELPTYDNEKSISYEVKEVEGPDGYISTIHSSEIPSQPGTETDAWIPAYSIDNNTEYLMIAEGSDKGFKASGTTMEAVDISSSRISGINAYKLDASNQLTSFTSNTNFGMKDSSGNNEFTMTALKLNNNGDTYLASSSSGTGLRILNNSSGDPIYWKSFDGGFSVNVSDGALNVKDPSKNDYQVLFNGSSFGTSSMITGSKVQLYKKGKAYEGRVNGGTEFRITNVKVSNSLTVIKTDDEADISQRQKLSGAVFGLFTQSDCSENSRMSFAVSEDGAYLYTSGSGETDLVTNTDGRIEISGLPEGTFYLKEIKAPNGYEIINSNPITIFYNNSSSSHPEISLSKEIQNRLIKYELPETGGAGTTVFYSSGLALIAGSIILYGFNRKRNRKEGEHLS